MNEGYELIEKKAESDLIWVYVFGTASFLVGFYVGGLLGGVKYGDLEARDIVTLIFSSALVYFAGSQVRLAREQNRIIKLQYRAYLDENRPRIILDKLDEKRFLFKNAGKLTAWHVKFTCWNITDNDEVKSPINIVNSNDVLPFYPSNGWSNGRKNLLIVIEYFDNEEKNREYTYARYFDVLITEKGMIETPLAT